MKHILALAMAAAWLIQPAWSQLPAQSVNQVTAPAPDANVNLYFYSSGNLIYTCTAPQNSPSSGNRWSVALSNLTNISVSSNVGTVNLVANAQFWVGQTIAVTGSATSALNATYKITAVSGMTATITTSGVSDGTYTDPVITTNNPVLNQAVWAIKALAYNGTNQLISAYWANSAASPNLGLACSNRANY